MARTRIGIPVAPLIIAAALALCAPKASAQLLSYDGFGNGPMANLAGSNGGTGWTSTWSSTGSNLTKVQAPGLNYPGLATTPGGTVTPSAGGASPNSIYRRSFPAPQAGITKIYAAFLMRPDAAFGNWGGVSFGQAPSAMYVGAPPGFGAYGLMISQGLGSVTTQPVVQGQTTLVVVKIAKKSGSGGTEFSLYLDPQIGGSEPSFPSAVFTLGSMQSLPTAIKIDNGTGFSTDEIRVGTTWSSVLPSAPNPWADLGSAKPGSVGLPQLAGMGLVTANSMTSIALTSARPLAYSILIVGPSIVNLPIAGGVLVPLPMSLFPMITNAMGSIIVQANWPAGVPVGTQLVFQYWIQDPIATLNLAASNGLQCTGQ